MMRPGRLLPLNLAFVLNKLKRPASSDFFHAPLLITILQKLTPGGSSGTLTASGPRTHVR